MIGGDQYSFSVTALNGGANPLADVQALDNGDLTLPVGGTSTQKTVTAVTTPPGAPSPPSIQQVTAGAGQITVGWSAPTADGGSLITSYIATAEDVTTRTNGGQTCTTATATKCTIDGVTDGDSYVVKVVAKNAISTSNPAYSTTPVVPVKDTDLALTKVPSDMTVGATGPKGATVDYTAPTVIDDGTTASVSCSKASGAIFPIGTTKVTCTASSSDDTPSTVSASFTVTVEGATAQLSDLASAVQGVGPGNSLAEKVHAAQSSLAADNSAKTCSTLGAFINEVRAQAGKKIGSSQARQLIADAQRIQAVLSCQGDQHHGDQHHGG